jgi:hypothetical protein
VLLESIHLLPTVLFVVTPVTTIVAGALSLAVASMTVSLTALGVCIRPHIIDTAISFALLSGTGVEADT